MNELNVLFLCNIVELAMLAYLIGKVVKYMKVRIESASLDALLDVAVAAQAHLTAADAADVTDKASLATAQQALMDLQAKLDTANTVLSNETDLSDAQSAKIAALTEPAPAPVVAPATDTTLTATTPAPAQTVARRQFRQDSKPKSAGLEVQSFLACLFLYE